MTDDDRPRSPPPQEPLGSEAPLEARLRAMTQAAEAIIDRHRAGPGDAATRYALGEMEIHFAMRDEFGPANAALFAARAKKLQELAGAVGLTGTPPPPAGGADPFVRDARAWAAELRAKGLDVTEAPVLARRLLWEPGDAVGWELTVRDPSRSVDEFVAYSGTPHGAPSPAAPAKVRPTVHLYLFPHRRLSASQSMVRREQPGEPAGAGAGAVAFRLQAPQSHDQDPQGVLGRAIESALFRDDSRAELPAAAKALGGGTAVLERGLLRVTGRSEPPAELPAVAAPGAKVVLWSVQHGADIDHTLLPLPSRG